MHVLAQAGPIKKGYDDSDVFDDVRHSNTFDKKPVHGVCSDKPERRGDDYKEV